MHFVNGNILNVLALAAVGLGLLALWTFRRDRKDLRELGHRNLVLSPVLAVLRRGTRGVLILAALAFCALGAARWQGKAVPDETAQYGMDIAIALDVSKSMLTRDVRPNRLEAAKNALARALPGLQGNRIGLVAFAGDAAVQVPLTLDMEALGTVLGGADETAVDEGGTSLPMAINACLPLFPKQDPKQPPRGKVILMLTDGEPTRDEGALGAVLEEARKEGVAIACVGVGTRKGQLIPDGQNFWGEPIYKQDRSGRNVVSRLDEETLSKIARVTGGVFVTADNAQALSRVGALLDGMKKSVLKDRSLTRREELAPLAAKLAVGFILLAALL